MLKYEIVIAWSNEDQVYVADSPELPGCMAHGDTYEEAVKSIQEAMEAWLEVARKYGDDIPEPKGWSLPGSDPVDPDDVPTMEELREGLDKLAQEEKSRRAKENRRKAS